ncbi:MAG: C69 family dipeptidase [Candidatus Nanopelagicales bacterium]
MCDTFVALGAATADGSMIFGKNSDREPNEAHELVVVPAADHAAGSEVRCTHITIPRTGPTRRMLLAKPYWIWGAEMGLNDAGVVLGNEALFNKGTKEDEPGLLGMDLLRLGLERAGSAAEAVTVITDLLERYGQGGQAGHTHDFTYDNSFLAADADEAWILETMGRDWVARRVTRVGSISNGLTTRTQWDLASMGVTDGTDVARRWTEPVFTKFAAAGDRQCRTTDALSDAGGRVDVAHAMAVLRGHRSSDPSWSPAYPVMGQDVCMHAGYGPVRSSQTTGSLVVRIGADGATAWVTGTAAPCTSIFKPAWVDSGLPDTGPRPRGWFDARTLWWRHELLHRRTLLDYPPVGGLPRRPRHPRGGTGGRCARSRPPAPDPLGVHRCGVRAQFRRGTALDRIDLPIRESASTAGAPLRPSGLGVVRSGRRLSERSRVMRAVVACRPPPRYPVDRGRGRVHDAGWGPRGILGLSDDRPRPPTLPSPRTRSGCGPNCRASAAATWVWPTPSCRSS